MGFWGLSEEERESLGLPRRLATLPIHLSAVRTGIARVSVPDLLPFLREPNG